MNRQVKVILNKFDRENELFEGDILFSDGSKFGWSARFDDCKVNFPISCTRGEMLEISRQLDIILRDNGFTLGADYSSQNYNIDSLVEAVRGLQQLEMMRQIDKAEKELKKEIRSLKRKAVIEDIKEKTISGLKKGGDVINEIKDGASSGVKATGKGIKVLGEVAGEAVDHGIEEIERDLIPFLQMVWIIIKWAFIICLSFLLIILVYVFINNANLEKERSKDEIKIQRNLERIKERKKLKEAIESKKVEEQNLIELEKLRKKIKEKEEELNERRRDIIQNSD